ncbi:hypothetical protein CDL15_Pgr013734 [Punica granatum]|uniref:Isopenicillin N synthase-like Fe(2+) 2OG dioxygenase domain-containing protein n=1 Tax=Punica granatum TaxID=22663 RepID=A0A218W114_PUNGR|nr:hypothetical protein CDL15_Pgr013734 [Punica granatum]
MSEMKRVVRSLLDLPIETKHRNKEVSSGSGYIAPGKLGSIYESLCISDLTSPEAVCAICSVLDASPEHRKLIEMYVQAVWALAINIADKDNDVVGGLEVVDEKSGSFVAVQPCPGTFFVNVGDFTVAWSNGRFSSVKHRVQCIEGGVRVSIGMLMFTPWDVAVESPEELIDSENP